MADFLGIEIRKQLRCQSDDTVYCFFTLDELVGECREDMSLTGDEAFVFGIYRDDERAQYIVRGRIAVVQTTTAATFTEWRIADIEDGGTGEDAVMMVRCFPIASDLVAAIAINEDDPLNVTHDYALVDATVETILDGPVRDALDFVGRDYIVTGTVERTAVFDQSGDMESALQMILQSTGDDKGGGEFRLRRNGTTDYQMDVLDSVGSTEPTLRLQTAENLTSLRRRRLRADAATWCIPQGRADGTCRGADYSIWRVADVVSSTQLELEDPRSGFPPPIRFTAQFTGFYLARLGVTFASHEITNTVVANQTVAIADTSTFSAGDYVEIRRTSGASGARLSYLKHPAGASSYGIEPRVLSLPSATGAVQYIPNGDASTWTDTATPDPPDDWEAFGTGGVVTIAHETTTTRFAGASLAIDRASGSGTYGIRSAIYRVYDDAAYTWKYWLWVFFDAITGTVNIRTVRADTDATVETLFSGSTVTTPAIVLGEWMLFELETANAGTAGGGLKLEVSAGGVGTWYVDAFGCQPAAWERTDVYGPFSTQGQCANDLHHAANDYLEQAVEPAAYDCSAIDLEQIDGTAFPQHAVAIGQPAEVYDRQLNLQVTGLRVLAYSRDHLNKTLSLRFGSALVAASEMHARRRRVITSNPVDADVIALELARGLEAIAAAPIDETNYSATVYDSGGAATTDTTLVEGAAQASQLAQVIRKSRNLPRA